MRIRNIVIGATALVLLAGCSTGNGTTGTPTATTQPAGTSTSTGTGGGAPEVKNPLDVKAFEADPCSAVTSAQIDAYGMPGVAGKVNTSSPGASCIWLGASTPAKVAPGLTILPKGTNLDSMYKNKDNGTYAVFEPLADVQGYPAVLTLATDQRSKGNCEIAVGVTAEQAILFTVQAITGSSRFADPCGAVTEFAGLAVTTIKAGAK
ncbi:Protein of unknown function [Lentzea xinjiangensis]|uniref:DUF3558 domain-containing protein n=1 Tax=Lentzea xinjiangensis TaxID=402600 RepID=A0A1H9TJF2_9PSEU|nr:DUF3558 domain-containing protein [Lentzea xinjiangensis]SER96723.1 Protein of unknown function [Lentzea xinjiangensis]